jgi:hypothetical protein
VHKGCGCLALRLRVLCDTHGATCSLELALLGRVHEHSLTAFDAYSRVSKHVHVSSTPQTECAGPDSHTPTHLAVPLKGQYVCRHPVQEPAVVRDDQRAASKVEDRLLKTPLGGRGGGQMG